MLKWLMANCYFHPSMYVAYKGYSLVILLCLYFIESSEQSVILLLDEFKAIGFEKLSIAAQQVGVLTNTHLETFEDAPNNVKKVEIILSALMSLPKPQLIHFTVFLATQGTYYAISCSCIR